jgi:AcrR family transcriptional regulator
VGAEVKDQPDGRASRWDSHREGRRAELVAAAVRAIDLHGADVRVAEIATEAGVSKPVLYRYFADKAELHAAVGVWGADEVLEHVLPVILGEGPMRERIERAVDEYLRVIEEHRQVFLLLVRHRVGGDPLADGTNRIASTVARILGNMLRQSGLDPSPAEVWARSLVGLGLTTGEWWLEQPSLPREVISKHLASFTWHAFEGASAEVGMPLSSYDPPSE